MTLRTREGEASGRHPGEGVKRAKRAADKLRYWSDHLREKLQSWARAQEVSVICLTEEDRPTLAFTGDSNAGRSFLEVRVRPRSLRDSWHGWEGCTMGP